MKIRDAYQILSLKPTATEEEASLVLRNLAAYWDPDRCPDDNDGLKRLVKKKRKLVVDAHRVVRKHIRRIAETETELEAAKTKAKEASARASLAKARAKDASREARILRSDVRAIEDELERPKTNAHGGDGPPWPCYFTFVALVLIVFLFFIAVAVQPDNEHLLKMIASILAIFTLTYWLSGLVNHLKRRNRDKHAT